MNSKKVIFPKAFQFSWRSGLCFWTSNSMSFILLVFSIRNVSIFVLMHFDDALKDYFSNVINMTFQRACVKFRFNF